MAKKKDAEEQTEYESPVEPDPVATSRTSVDPTSGKTLVDDTGWPMGVSRPG